MLEYPIKERGLKFPRFMYFLGGSFRFILPAKTQDKKQWETKTLKNKKRNKISKVSEFSIVAYT